MPVVFAAPYVPPVPPRNPWSGASVSWEGADGSLWSLDPESGVFLLPGVRGLTLPPMDQFTSRLSGGHGQRFRGWSAGPREVFWPLCIFEDTTDEGWLERDAAFWRSLRPDVAGTWTVTHPNGTSRSLKLRLTSDGDKAWDVAPGSRAWTDYGIYLVADQPFWEGQVVGSPVWGQDEAPVDFIPAEGAPDFYLSGASTVGNASLTNPGDVDAPLVWTVTGPTTSVSLTVGGDTIGVPFPVLDGQTLVIDTGAPVALLDGVDVTGQLDAAGFASLPARATTDLGIVMSGTGTVRAEFVPLHERAW